MAPARQRPHPNTAAARWSLRGLLAPRTLAPIAAAPAVTTCAEHDTEIAVGEGEVVTLSGSGVLEAGWRRRVLVSVRLYAGLCQV